MSTRRACVYWIRATRLWRRRLSSFLRLNKFPTFESCPVFTAGAICYRLSAARVGKLVLIVIMHPYHVIVWTVAINFSLSYFEKNLLDRLLTYYDDKIRPTDQRNFFIPVQSDDQEPQPLIVNISLRLHRIDFHDNVLALDLEFSESWYDDRLKMPQHSDKTRRNFQLPDDARIWHPNGNPVANFEESQKSRRKVTLSDKAKLVSTSRFLVRTHCDSDHSPVEPPFSESYKCIVQFEPEDIHDVNYFYRHDQHRLQLTPLEDFSYNSTIEAVQWDGNHFGFDKNVGDQLVISISLTRSSANHYLITAIGPSSLAVFLVWVTLFNQRRMIRAVFQSTSFFVLIVLWGSFKRPSTATKLDGWLLLCLLFISICVVESVFLACIPWSKSKNSDRTERDTESMISTNRLVVVNSVQETRHSSNGNRVVQIEQYGRRVRRCIDMERVHIGFAFSCPLVFIGVSLWYWLKASV